MEHLKILLVEDEPDHAELIKKQISQCGDSFSIDWANSLSNGLNKLDNRKYDVILLDLGLPGCTREKTLNSFLPKSPDIPIVVLSAMTDEDFAIKAVHKGAQDYICKGRMTGDTILRSIRYAIERKQITAELIRANRAKDEFLSTLSHELRSPVGIIQSYAEILNRDNAPEELKGKAAEVIYRHATHQLRLVDDLLDMSRILNGKVSLSRKPIDILEVLERSLETQKVTIESKHINILRSVDPSATMINGDYDRLQQIFVNLISNAVKFSPPNSKIEVKVEKVKSNVQISVIDHGKGIDRDFLPYVFDRFKQHDGSKSRGFGGLGLGMAITRQLVELHGGSISVFSEGEGQGATFTVLIPLLAVAIKPNSQAENTQGTCGNDTSLAGLSILAVDDSQDILALIKIILTRYGAKVSTAVSAVDAAQIICQQKPDVLLCDIGMPDEDGYTFLKKLRKKEFQKGKAPIPACALTAYARPEDKQEAINSGFNLHLAKPVKESDLVRSILKLSREAISKE